MNSRYKDQTETQSYYDQNQLIRIIFKQYYFKNCLKFYKLKYSIKYLIIYEKASSIQNKSFTKNRISHNKNNFILLFVTSRSTYETVRSCETTFVSVTSWVYGTQGLSERYATSFATTLALYVKFELIRRNKNLCF